MPKTRTYRHLPVLGLSQFTLRAIGRLNGHHPSVDRPKKTKPIVPEIPPKPRLARRMTLEEWAEWKKGKG